MIGRPRVRRLLPKLALACLVAACVAPGTAGSSSTTQSAEPTIVVEIAPGLAPRMEVADVESRVLTDLRTMAADAAVPLAPPAIRSVRAIHARDLKFAEPGAQTDVPADSIVWVVRAAGTFVALHGPGPSRLTSSSGFYVIDDRDGSILAYGLP